MLYFLFVWRVEKAALPTPPVQFLAGRVVADEGSKATAPTPVEGAGATPAQPHTARVVAKEDPKVTASKSVAGAGPTAPVVLCVRVATLGSLVGPWLTCTAGLRVSPPGPTGSPVGYLACSV